jgi:hypothetical protein
MGPRQWDLFYTRIVLRCSETVLSLMNAKDPPERLLLQWLDQYFDRYAPPGPEWIWRISSKALRRYLLAPEHPWSEQAARVLTSTEAIGLYLAKLQKLFSHRFRLIHTASENLWQIKPSPLTQTPNRLRQSKGEATIQI